MDTNIIRGIADLNGTDTYTCNLTVKDSAYVHGGWYLCRCNSTNTVTNPTFNFNSIGAKTVYRNDLTALQIGELKTDSWFAVMYDAGEDKLVLLSTWPYQGVDTNALTAGGGTTVTLIPGTHNPIQLITGNATLSSNYVFTFGGSPKDGDRFVFDYRATMTLGAQTITIAGISLTAVQALAGNLWIEAYYDTDGAEWRAKLLSGGTGGIQQVFADDAARAAAVPDYIGQLGEQIDTRTTYHAYGTTADDWRLPANTQVQSDTYAVATGTDTYAITLTPALVAYAAGNSFKVLFTNGNTTASTINVNALGAKAIRKNASVALVAGDIIAGKEYLLTYDGTNFQIESNDSQVKNVQVSADKYAVASGTDTYAITLSPAPAAYAAGNMYNVTFTNANTGASTINVNTLGAKNIFYNGAALVGGEILAATGYSLLYDGTQFHLIGSLGINSIQYKKYVANISQSGSDAPTAIVLENTIGEIVWTRTNVGIYVGTLLGAFTTAKTQLYNGTVSRTVGVVTLVNNGSEDNISLLSLNASLAAADDILGFSSPSNGTSIEIRVYP